MTVLVTGGAGYIGSHTCVELLEAGLDVVVVDNLSNSCEEAVRRVTRITGKKLRFIKADICGDGICEGIFAENPDICAVIHFAGLKAVGESVERPLEYYANNIGGAVRLLLAMRKCGVKRLVFSSSATVYGDPASVPVSEDFPTSATNPYGYSKLAIERIIEDTCRADPDFSAVTLRYFNPIGAHPSGLIGEDPDGVPNNLVPYISQVAIGKLERLKVFGGDYPTHDGTGVRDYIHVTDLARGHIAALERARSASGLSVYNLGTGKGYSVLDVVKAYAKASGREIPYAIAPRRPGDVAEVYADPEKAARELNWRAQHGIDDMCAHSWNWQVNNPDGYADI